MARHRQGGGRRQRVGGSFFTGRRAGFYSALLRHPEAEEAHEDELTEIVGSINAE